jgi:hypothetical protein
MRNGTASLLFSLLPLFTEDLACIAHGLRNELVEEFTPDLVGERDAELAALLVGGGKNFWDPEQSDRHLASRGGTRIASQPLCPRETIMGTLGTGKGRRHNG